MGVGGAAGALKKSGGIKCGARKAGGKGSCSLPAGWGTNHYGLGACKLHGGCTPNQIKSAAKAEYRQLFGTPMEINPLDALLWCIKITAGEIHWLSQQMAKLDEKSWVEDTIVGKQFHLYARERVKRQQDLARFSAQAISLGIAERAIKLAETYGDMIARLIQGILADLELNEEQRARVPIVVRRHLLLLDGAQPDLPTPEGGTRKAVPQIEAA